MVSTELADPQVEESQVALTDSVAFCGIADVVLAQETESMR